MLKSSVTDLTSDFCGLPLAASFPAGFFLFVSSSSPFSVGGWFSPFGGVVGVAAGAFWPWDSLPGNGMFMLNEDRLEFSEVTPTTEVESIFTLNL